MAPEHLSSRNQFGRNAGGEFRELVVQERGESIEIGERVERPLDVPKRVGANRQSAVSITDQDSRDPHP